MSFETQNPVVRAIKSFVHVLWFVLSKTNLVPIVFFLVCMFVLDGDDRIIATIAVALFVITGRLDALREQIENLGRRR